MQLLYLLTLLGFLAAGAYLVVRQVHMRCEGCLAPGHAVMPTACGRASRKCTCKRMLTDVAADIIA